MGQAAAPYVMGAGMGLGALGDAKSAKSASNSANAYLQTVFGPTNATRAALGNIFANSLGRAPGGLVSMFPDRFPDTARVQGDSMSPGPMLPLGLLRTPLTNSIESRYREMLSPEYREQTLLAQNPDELMNRIGETRRPVFQSNLNDSLDAIGAKFGAWGMRPGTSSDYYWAAAKETTDAENKFEADLMNLYPDLYGKYLTGETLYQGAVGQAGAWDQARLNSLLSLLASFISPMAAYPPSAGLSGLGAGMSSAGGAATAWPILQSLLDDGGNWINTERDPSWGPTSPAGK